jgi:hypothetical protein
MSSGRVALTVIFQAEYLLFLCHIQAVIEKYFLQIILRLVDRRLIRIFAYHLFRVEILKAEKNVVEKIGPKTARWDLDRPNLKWPKEKRPKKFGPKERFFNI